MERTLPALPSWRPLQWTLYAIGSALLLGLNLALFGDLHAWALKGLANTDWANIVILPANPYDNLAFRWTPPAAWGWETVVEPLGLVLWRLLHVAAVLTLPPLVAGLALLSAPFWFDVANGNVMTFALVAAWHGLNGNRAGIIGFVILAALVPRPLMLPVLVVLLCRYPLARWTFAGAALVVLGWSLGTGLLDDFLARLLHAGGREMTLPYNYAPSRLIGLAWVPIGLVLGAWLAWKGRYGLASLAVSPYLFPYYLLMGLLEARPAPRSPRGSVPRWWSAWPSRRHAAE